MHEHFVSYIYIGHIKIDGGIILFKSNTRDPRSVYVSPRSYCQPRSSLLDCVSNNTYYGYYYRQSCSDGIGVICCPNGKIIIMSILIKYIDKIHSMHNNVDTALCSFQPTAKSTSDCVATTTDSTITATTASSTSAHITTARPSTVTSTVSPSTDTLTVSPEGETYNYFKILYSYAKGGGGNIECAIIILIVK